LVIALIWQSRNPSSGKARDFARAFINKRQRRIVEIFHLGLSIFGGLVFDLGQLKAFVGFLGLDHANGLFVHEEQVIRRAGIGLIFAHGNTQGRAEVDQLFALHDPTASLELFVYVIARDLFWILIDGVCWHGVEEKRAHRMFYQPKLDSIIIRIYASFESRL
jgi:hypothetical protein